MPQAKANDHNVVAEAEGQRDPATDLRNSGGTTLPLWIWLGGSMLLLARFCLARVWLAQRRRTAAPAEEDSLGLIARWQTSFGLLRVQSQVWAGLRGPVAFGVFRPTVALPPDFAARFSCAERETMLVHEMAHLAAHDPFWWIVSDAVIALAWWHPLAWWARRQLQSAHEAAADEASALIPGGAHTLAECLVRLGRELTTPGPARALGLGGNGPRSQLAARVERLVRGPRAWQPLSVWARWTPQASAIFIAMATALLPIQTGLSGSILAVLAVSTPARADAAQGQASIAITNQAANAAPLATVAETPVVMPRAPALVPATNSQPEALMPNPKERSRTRRQFAAASPASASNAGADSPSNIVASPSNVAAFVPAISPLVPDAATNARPKVLLLIRLASLTEPSSAELGLDWVFGLPPTNNPALEIGHDWTFGLEPQDVPKGKTNQHAADWRTTSTAHTANLLIEHLRTDGQSAVLKPGQFAALRDRIELCPGDLLAAPKCLAFSGQEACVKTLNMTTVVTGVEANAETANVGYFADTIGVGPTVEIVPTLQDDGKWRLRVRASVAAFLGYDKHTNEHPTVSLPGGKPLGYEIPHPHFRALEADADDSLLLGETLALRGPLWAETTKTKAHFLVPAKTTDRSTTHSTSSLTPTPPISVGDEVNARSKINSDLFSEGECNSIRAKSGV